MDPAPNQRTMTVPRQRRVIGAERSTWQENELLPAGYAYLYLGDQQIVLNGIDIILPKATP